MATYQGEGMRPTLAQREQKEAEVSFRQHSWGPRSPSPSPKPWCVQLPVQVTRNASFSPSCLSQLVLLCLSYLALGFSPGAESGLRNTNIVS